MPCMMECLLHYLESSLQHFGPDFWYDTK
jgi:hypothetical protein